MADVERAYDDLREHVDSLEVDETTEKVLLTRELAIDCPDCGPQIAFNGKCPKCGGESWSPRGKTNQKPATSSAAPLSLPFSARGCGEGQESRGA